MRSVATSNPYPPPIDIAESRSAGSRFASAPPIIGESESRDIGLAKGGELSSLALLRTLDPISLAALEAELVRICVPGGETLFRENDFADALYIVIAGSLAVTVRNSNGRDMLVARIRSGEIVGEMALLDGGLRSATVEAVRDTELLRLDRLSYERLVERHPKSMLALTSLLSKRLRDTTHHLDGQVPVRTVAIVPLGPDADHYGVAHNLASRLLDDGHRALLLDHELAAHTSEWFDAVETANDLVSIAPNRRTTPGPSSVCGRPTECCSLRPQPRVMRHQNGWPISLINCGNPLTSLCCTTRVLLAAEPLSVGANDCALASSATFGVTTRRTWPGWLGCCEVQRLAWYSAREVRVVSRI